MTTIEEARETVERKVRAYRNNALNAIPSDGIRPVMEAADAYALAVLEEAVISANLLLVKVAGEDPIMSGHTLRARIKAAGK